MHPATQPKPLPRKTGGRSRWFSQTPGGEQHPDNCTCASVTDTEYPEGLGEGPGLRKVVFHTRRVCEPRYNEQTPGGSKE